MFEIDHTAGPKPEPARPILASHLLVIEEKQRKRFAERGERIKTGCDELDGYVLGGGFERGIVVGLSGEGTEGRLISLNLLTSILLSHLPPTTSQSPTKPIATIIDTTGSFPISVLASIIKSRLTSLQATQSRNQVTSENHQDPDVQKTSGTDIEKEVQRCLEMVAISRVFDIEGLWEVLGEINRDTSDVEDLGAGTEGVSIPEANEEDSTTLHAHVQTTTKTQQQFSSGGTHDEGTEIIIIDTMTHIINELFSRKEKSESHTLLTLLSRALHNLTQSTNILTILHNTTVSSKPSSNYPKHTQQNLFTSIFTTNPLKPALGKIFSSLPTLHILLSSLPKRKEDAEFLYAPDDSPFNSQAVEYCTVIEVLKDETPVLKDETLHLDTGTKKSGIGAREGRWCAVQVGSDGMGVVSAFEEKGAMGEGGGRDKDKVQDVGSVAKIYGFGGRRV